jgi:uncharacterized protein
VILDASAQADFLRRVRHNPINATLLDRLPELGLDDCWLVAGCLFETIWNEQAGRPPTENIRDYDIFYFDAADLSYEAEDREIRRITAAFTCLDAKIELKNQARVHLWYEKRFGHPYPVLTSSTDGINRFLVACTCVAVRCTAGLPLAIHAANGMDDLFAGILRPNPINFEDRGFAEKARSYQSRWPWLRVDRGHQAGLASSNSAVEM